MVINVRKKRTTIPTHWGVYSKVGHYVCIGMGQEHCLGGVPNPKSPPFMVLGCQLCGFRGVAPTNSFRNASQVVRLAQGFNYHPLSSISARKSSENLAKTAAQIIFNNPLDLSK